MQGGGKNCKNWYKRELKIIDTLLSGETYYTGIINSVAFLLVLSSLE